MNNGADRFVGSLVNKSVDSQTFLDCQGAEKGLLI